MLLIWQVWVTVSRSANPTDVGRYCTSFYALTPVSARSAVLAASLTVGIGVGSGRAVTVRALPSTYACAALFQPVQCTARANEPPFDNWNLYSRLYLTLVSISLRYACSRRLDLSTCRFLKLRVLSAKLWLLKQFILLSTKLCVWYIICFLCMSALRIQTQNYKN